MLLHVCNKHYSTVSRMSLLCCFAQCASTRATVCVTAEMWAQLYVISNLSTVKVQTRTGKAQLLCLACLCFLSTLLSLHEAKYDCLVLLDHICVPDVRPGGSHRASEACYGRICADRRTQKGGSNTDSPSVTSEKNPHRNENSG